MEPISLPKHWATNWMVDQGVDPHWLSFFTLLVDVGILIGASLLADFIARLGAEVAEGQLGDLDVS